jgi:Domain of unknown function (DUF3597)
MGLFETLKNAIFRHGTTSAAASTATSSAVNSPDRAAGSQPVAPSAAPTKSPASATGTSPASPGQSVDVEAILNQLNAKSQQKLNWRTSIVDLMKLVGMDSSLEHRKELAVELGYTGDTADSASMNVWLHKQVMVKLAASGGKVPADLQR